MKLVLAVCDTFEEFLSFTLNKKKSEVCWIKVWRVASVTSYLSENEAENLQNGDVHYAQINEFEMGYFENHLAH